ncbi:RING finger 151-like [Paramuricea clavata]|uniref:RING finger 151-like n=1 Tax=Paramuricea clavata TaxID=317549 RepID=A0A7D9EMS9_PARCT|nr:RING finger 151-like [Paramuricea clavata]
MATGYEDSRFETQVDESLHCVICTEVLKDPVQCRRNEHHFCRNCITKHLRHSRNCLTCKDPLTVETLARPQRFLANTLSSLKISCENSERGCRKVVELGSLDTHVATCGFSPMPCSNDQCEEIISRRDKEIHENKVCDFRRVKCDYCAQMVLYKNFMQHTCPPRQEIREIKAELREVRSTCDQMLRMMSNLTTIVSNIPRRPEGSHESSDQELQAEIVVAGGVHCKSVEVFNMATKTWRPLSEMNECKDGASSVLYQGHMIVTGGFSDQDLDSVEKLNLVDGQWIEEIHFKLPAPSNSHTCVVHQNRLLVIGGDFPDKISNAIHEIQLTPPYTSRLLTKMPRAICYHGGEIVNDKVYIFGGSTTGFGEATTDYVLMFDPATNTCKELNPLPHPVSHMATVAWKDNVVVLGGEDKEGNIFSEVILYNVATKRHRMLPEMRQKRRGCTAVTIGDNIIAMGGKDETNTRLRSVECYNFQTNTWTEFPAMAEARVYATAVVKYP